MSLKAIFTKQLKGTIMTQKIHTSMVPQAKQPQVAFHLPHSNLTSTVAEPHKRHISYGRRDVYILQIEKQLMEKYHIGFSGLHKMLVIKEGNQQFSRPFL
jgi:hypothetical protein